MLGTGRSALLDKPIGLLATFELHVNTDWKCANIWNVRETKVLRKKRI